MKGKTDKLSKSKLHAFHADNSQPSRQFEKRLREEFLSFADDSTLSPSFKLISIIKMLRFKQIAPKLMAITALVAILGGVTLPTAIHRYQVRQARSNLDTLLSKAVSNNRSHILAYDERTVTTSAKAQNLTLAPTSISFDLSTHTPTLIKNIVSYKQGPALDKCELLDTTGKNGSETSWIFTDERNKIFANKSIFRDNSDKLREYFLFIEKDSHTDSYEYYGGQYAVHIYEDLSDMQFFNDDLEIDSDVDIPNTSEEETLFSDEISKNDSDSDLVYSKPTGTATAKIDTTKKSAQEEPLHDVEPSLQDMFGEDATLEDIVKIDGHKYYVIQWTDKLPCSMGQTNLLLRTASPVDDINELNNNWDTITTRGYFDTETMILKQEDMYYGDVSEDNLMLHTLYEESVISENTSWDDAKSNFIFNLDVPVKDIEIKPEESVGSIPRLNADKIIQELTTSKYNLIIPEDNDFEITEIDLPSIWSHDSQPLPMIPEEMQYMQDRDFYSDDEYGEKMYEQMHITELSAPSDDMPSITGSMMPDNIPVPDVVLMYTSSKTGDPDDGDLYEISLGHGLADTDITQYVYGIDGDPTEDTLIVDGRKIVSQHYMLNTDFTGEKPGDIYTFETKDGDSYTVFVSHQNPEFKLPTFRTVVSNDPANRDFIEDLVNATTGRK